LNLKLKYLCVLWRNSKINLNMNRFFATLAIVLYTSSVVFAQAPAAKSDPAAKKVLDQVSAKVKSYSTIKINFSLTIQNAEGKVESKKTGTVYMKGAKYRVSLPPGVEMFSDGSNTWNYDKSSNEVKIDKVDESAGALTPQKLFTNFYDKDYLYKLNDDTKVNGKPAQEIELTPFDKTKPFFKVLLEVDPVTKNIVSTRLFEKNGTRITYTANTFSPNNPSVTDAIFVFDQTKYPGVEVVDLR
jgi:outer membrane lipoprotein carrier protein